MTGAIGIMSAMPDELAAVLAEVEEARIDELAGRKFHVGRLHGRPVVAVVARIGKVAAATTATMLIDRYRVGAVVFTGLAGAVSAELAVGDIVVADHLLQHDLDARPLFPRYEIPLLGVAAIATDDAWTARAAGAARGFIDEDLAVAVDDDTRRAFDLARPKVRRGLVVSGDQFFASAAEIAALRARLPEALAVEMEGAAVAQVCHELGVPCAVVRTISDAGDDAAHRDFARFLGQVCGAYARGVVRRLVTAA